jgi:hypothetical protein
MYCGATEDIFFFQPGITGIAVVDPESETLAAPSVAAETLSAPSVGNETLSQ